MNDNISDVMVDKFKILILHALRNIKIADIRKIILEKAFGKYYMTSNILFIFTFWYLGLLTPLLVPAEVD